MYILSIVLPLALSLSSITSAAVLPKSVERNVCSDIHIITARGSTEYQPPNPNVGADGGQIISRLQTDGGDAGRGATTGEGEIGYLADAFQNVTSTKKSITRSAVVYPALYDNATIYEASVYVGVQNLAQQVKYQAERCPRQKLVLLGYSQGAQVVGDALAGFAGGFLGPAQSIPAISANYSSAISAIVMWGDPRQVLGSKFVIGQPLPLYSGIFGRPDDQLAILQNVYGSKLQSYCNRFDKFCASGALAANEVTLGNYSTVIHDYSYLLLAVDPAVEFLKSKTR